MQSLNLGILAHVDAGKTSLTERLLYSAGVIDQLGSVDKGDTQTDTLALERRRGITIKSAVASFSIADDLVVNLIDTPGHPDFIAEVERVLRVLDGAVLVLSAVEGVQPQTRVLMRALRRLRIPTLLFVEQDRPCRCTRGARAAGDLPDTWARHHPDGGHVRPRDQGGRFQTVGRRTTLNTDLSSSKRSRSTMSRLLTSYVEEEGRLPLDRLQEQLRTQTQHGLVHPVFFGSARTGAGIDPLMSGIADLLPRTAPPAIPTLKRRARSSRSSVERHGRRSPTCGCSRALCEPAIGSSMAKATRTKSPRSPLLIASPTKRSTSVSAGNIARIWGLRNVQIGDRIGQVGTDESDQQFAPPTMESVVEAHDPADRARLRVALGELAEQDPFIKSATRRQISTRHPCRSMGRFRRKSSSPHSRTTMG